MKRRRPARLHPEIVCANGAEAISFQAWLAEFGMTTHAPDLNARFPEVVFLDLRPQEQDAANRLYGDWARERAAEKARGTTG